ncbi:hypothetical protein NEOLEDRAFT_1052215, partial [Neolentinus lepideus HHB14362 ss-1]
KCIFVGYAREAKAWEFWDPVTQKFYISSNAVFDERCFPGNSKSINVFGVPLAPPTPDNLTGPLPDQGGDDSDDDDPPAPPAAPQAPFQPPPASRKPTPAP